MALSERLAYVLDFNVQGAVKGLEKVGATADKELGKADAKLDKLGANLTKFGAGALAVAGVAGAALLSMGNKASDLQETVSKSDTVFKENADEIRAWAETAATSFGQSQNEALAAASSFGNMFAQLGIGSERAADMSMSITELASDFASFHNADITEVLNAQQAAFRGEYDAIQRFIPTMNAAAVEQRALELSGKATTAELTAQDKALASNALMMEGAGDAAGDFARTSDSAANKTRAMKAQMEDLQAKIGAGVLPIMEKLLGVGIKLVAGFDSLNDATGGNLGKFAAFGVAGLAVVGVLSTVAGTVIKARDNFKELGTALQSSSGKATVFKTAIGVAGVALLAYSLNARAANDDLNDLSAGLANTARQSDEAAAATVQQIAGLASITGDLKPAIDQFVQGNIEAAKRLIETGAAAEGGAEFLDLLTEAIEAEEKARAQNTAVLEEHAEVIDADTAAIEDNTAKAGHASQAQRDYEQQLLRANEAARDNKRALEESNWYIRKQADDAADASREIVGLRDAHAGLRAELEDRSAYLDLQDAFDNVAIAATEAYTASSEGAEDAEAKARDHERAQIDLKNKVLDYIDALGNIPPEVASDILALIDEGQLAAVEEKLAWLSRDRFAAVKIRLSGGTLTNDGQIKFGTGNIETAGAEGGIINRPTVLLAGEAGPEALIPLDKSPGNGPLPASLSGDGGGNTYNINIDAPLGVTEDTIQRFRQVVEEIERRRRAGA